ncbi:MAG TPA: serine/threonine-protein kinase [Prosthecobacter sp.]
MPRVCPDCASQIPDAFPAGLCPQCLLAAALPPETAPASTRPPELELAKLQRLFPELEILHPLGAGGMGAVYLARQPRLDRQVALKVMRCPPGKEVGFGLRFEREAQVLARLAHPHIVAIHDFGEMDAARTGGAPLFYILLEHVDGTDLGRRIQAGDLTPAEVLKIIPQICDGLQHAHDRGITHRDIKPANILMDAAGVVKIADFGLARIVGGTLEGEGMTGLTQTGATLGTPHYMAPEQWAQPPQVDHRADIYALGVVFYEMLTGERPGGAFSPPSRKNAQVSREFDRVVLRAMDESPARRYQQAAQVKEAVARLTPAGPASRRRRWSLAVSAAVPLLAALGYFGLRPGREPEGGRLVAMGTLRGGRPIDLGRAAGISDFVQVCLHDHGWIALRANCQTVASDGRGERAGVRRILPGLQSRFTLLYDAGRVELVPQANDSPTVVENLPPALAETGVEDLVFDAWQGLALLRDGSALVWGRRYDNPQEIPEWAGRDVWPPPPREALQKVRAIAITPLSAATVTQDGRLWLWGGAQARLPAEADALQGRYAAVLSTTSGLFDARLKDGRTLQCNLSLRTAKISPSGVTRSMYGGYRPLHQRADGGWFTAWPTPGLQPFLEKAQGRPDSAFSLMTFAEDAVRVSTGLIFLEPAAAPGLR